jgi:CysZ protein
MLVALFRAVGNLFQPALRRVVGLSLAIAVASFAGLWLTLAIVLEQNARFGWRPLDWLVDLLGAFVALLVTWFLFPAVVTLVMGFFLDRIAGAVEALDYPGKGPARHAPIAETTKATLRLMVFAVILNLLALPVYVLAPGMNFFVFLGLNGYLLGREYFEVVALRRLDQTAVRTVRHRFTGRVFLGGVVIAGLFIVPLLNLVAPVIATAFMVHLFEGLRRAEPQLMTS